MRQYCKRIDGKTAKAFTQRLQHDVVPLAFLGYYLKMSSCHCFSCSHALTLGELLVASFHCSEWLKEIHVSSLEQSSHFKKKKDKHDVGHSKLEWMENREISSHSCV